MTRPAHTASTRSTMSRAGADSRASSHQERLITPSSSSSSSASLATASPHSHRHLTPTDEYKHSTRGHRRPAPGHDDELRPRPPPAYPFVLPQQPLGMTIRHYRQPDRPFYFPTPVLNDPIPPPYTQLQRWSDITRRGSQGSNENLANLADLALTASQHSAAYVKPAAPLTPTRPHQLRQNPPGRVTLVRSIQNGRITLPPLSSFDDPPTPLNRAGDIRHWSPPAGTIKESKSRSAPVALDDTLRDPLCHKSQESYERGFLTAAKNTVGTLQSRRDFSLGVEAEADSERDNESRRTSQVSTLSWQSSERSEPPGESSQETSLSFGSSTNQEVCGGGDDQKDTWEGRTEDIRSRKRLRFGESSTDPGPNSDRSQRVLSNIDLGRRSRSVTGKKDTAAGWQEGASRLLRPRPFRPTPTAPTLSPVLAASHSNQASGAEAEHKKSGRAAGRER